MSRNEKYVTALKLLSRYQNLGLIKDAPEAVDAAIRELDDYQGWTNRETWATALHISNSEWTESYKRDLLALVRRIPTRVGRTPEQHERFEYADKLKDWVEEMFTSVLNPEVFRYSATHGQVERNHPKPDIVQRIDIARMITDVGSLWRVEWQEIADSWISDDPAPAEEPEPDEDEPTITTDVDGAHYVHYGKAPGPFLTVKLIECGSCGNYHRRDYDGDCRDDAERFTLDQIESGKR